MVNSLGYLLFLGASLIGSYFLTLFFKKLSFKLKILDYPNSDRKIHKKATPLLGGWAIYLSFLFLILLILFFKKELIISEIISLKNIIGILMAGFLIMLGGTLDDKYNLSPGQQFFWIILATLIVILSGVSVDFITHPGGGVISLRGLEMEFLGQSIYSLGAIITFIWLFLMINTTKLLDGLDGLASGITAIGMLILFIVSLFWDQAQSGTSLLIVIFMGSILGFLILNFHPAQIFLGNGGSMLLGMMLGVLAIISGAKIATALLVMGLPLLDMLWVIIQRIVKRESPLRHADRKHLHFKLLDAGFSKKQAVLFLYLASFVFGLIALFQSTVGKIFTILILIVFVSIIFYYIYRLQNKLSKTSIEIEEKK
ncbi:undecaprenyl/decaprenyl-phosphate alpha-N-acetylglucosaminyl 1-phosphate transferase [bacterium]|nr:undecaprenyl/decaprenyl-phosphate alpha-N-acetylglucosaminyl 1-phosphate transferase [bacterium]